MMIKRTLVQVAALLVAASSLAQGWGSAPASVLKVKEVVLGADQLRHLLSSPVTLIPAPGYKKVIVVHHVLVESLIGPGERASIQAAGALISNGVSVVVAIPPQMLLGGYQLIISRPGMIPTTANNDGNITGVTQDNFINSAVTLSSLGEDKDLGLPSNVLVSEGASGYQVGDILDLPEGEGAADALIRVETLEQSAPAAVGKSGGERTYCSQGFRQLSVLRTPTIKPTGPRPVSVQIWWAAVSLRITCTPAAVDTRWRISSTFWAAQRWTRRPFLRGEWLTRSMRARMRCSPIT